MYDSNEGKGLRDLEGSSRRLEKRGCIVSSIGRVGYYTPLCQADWHRGLLDADSTCIMAEYVPAEIRYARAHVCWWCAVV